MFSSYFLLIFFQIVNDEKMTGIMIVKIRSNAMSQWLLNQGPLDQQSRYHLMRSHILRSVPPFTGSQTPSAQPPAMSTSPGQLKTCFNLTDLAGALSGSTLSPPFTLSAVTPAMQTPQVKTRVFSISTLVSNNEAHTMEAKDKTPNPIYYQE